MNITTLLNRKPSLLVSTTKLTSLVLKNNRQEIVTKSLLLKKREKISKERIKTFRQIQANADRKDGTSLLEGGLASAGGLSLLRGKKPVNNIRPFRRPIKPGRLSGLRGITGRISKGSVITNTLFAGLDFANRKSAGQTNLQAGLGAGGGAVGGIAGAAIGQALIPVPVLGALIGGFVGSTIGSGLADRASGVTGGDFRRLQLERESIRQLGRTEFTDGLDRFDSALDKFKKYDDDLKGLILRATGNDDQNRAFNTIIPRRPGGATQAQIDAAYGKGISIGAGGLALAVIGTVAIVKGGPALLSGTAMLKLKSLGGILLKRTGGKALYAKLLKWYKGYRLNKRLMESDFSQFPGISKRGQLVREGNKILRELQGGSTKRPNISKENLNKFFEAIKNADLKPRIRFKPDFNKIYKSKRLRDIIKRRREDAEILKKGEEFADKVDLLEQIRKVPFDEFADDIIKKTERLKILDFIKKIDKDIINRNLRSDNTIINEGDNYFVNNLGGGTVISEGEPDPYLASLNTIKALSELTA